MSLINWQILYSYMQCLGYMIYIVEFIFWDKQMWMNRQRSRKAILALCVWLTFCNTELTLLLIFAECLSHRNHKCAFNFFVLFIGEMWGDGNMFHMNNLHFVFLQRKKTRIWNNNYAEIIQEIEQQKIYIADLQKMQKRWIKLNLLSLRTFSILQFKN